MEGPARESVVVKRATYRVGRRLDGLMPLDVLWFLYWPLAAIRAARDARIDAHGRMLVRELRPLGPTERPSVVERWWYYLAMNLRRPILTWSDRMGAPRWRERFTVEGMEHLPPLPPEQGVVVIFLHTGATTVLGSWLAALGFRVGGITVSPAWRERPDLLLRTQHGDAMGSPGVFLPGESREMIRFLDRGGCLLVGADHPVGHVVETTWSGRRLRLSTGAFRMARATGAVAIPMLAMDDGRWRFRISIGQPVPSGSIASGDHLGAATHVARELLPIAAAHPREALGTLIEAMR